jgi:hypothetical protein
MSGDYLISPTWLRRPHVPHGWSSLEAWNLLFAQTNAERARFSQYAINEAGGVQAENHVMNRGRRNAKEALQVGFRRRHAV